MLKAAEEEQKQSKTCLPQCRRLTSEMYHFRVTTNSVHTGGYKSLKHLTLLRQRAWDGGALALPGTEAEIEQDRNGGALAQPGNKAEIEQDRNGGTLAQPGNEAEIEQDRNGGALSYSLGTKLFITYLSFISACPTLSLQLWFNCTHIVVVKTWE